MSYQFESITSTQFNLETFCNQMFNDQLIKIVTWPGVVDGVLVNAPRVFPDVVGGHAQVGLDVDRCSSLKKNNSILS